MNKIQIVFVTSLQPETHYSRYLIKALEGQLGDKAILSVYADNHPANAQLPLKNVELVWSPTLSFPFQIARRVGKDQPSIIHVQHEINMYGGPFTAILFPVLLILLKFTRVEIVITIHSVVPADQIDAEFMRTFMWPPYDLLAYFVRLFFRLLYWSIGHFASRVIVHSYFMGSLLREHYGVPSDKVRVIPIGVPASRVLFAESGASNHPWLKLIESKKVILYFGYIIRRKGLEYLIESFEEIQTQYPEYVLVLAGGELDYQREYACSLRADVARRGLEDRILFTSFVSEGEIEELFARCEFVVLPYTYSISSSLPLSFAMEYGKPVIATDLGTLAEEVEDEVTGLLVPVRNSVALSKAMQRLIGDRVLLRQLAEGSRAKGRQRSWTTIAGETIQVYRSVCDELDL